MTNNKKLKVEAKEQEEQETEREGMAIGDTPDDVKNLPFGSIKPEFNRLEKCEIAEARFQTDGKIITKSRDGADLPKEDQYKRHWLSVRFKYTKDNEEKFFSQTYGSVRQYSDRLWISPACNLAELKGVLEAFVSVPLENLWDMGKELLGKKCLVKSIPYAVGNNKGFSNKIQDFEE